MIHAEGRTASAAAPQPAARVQAAARRAADRRQGRAARAGDAPPAPAPRRPRLRGRRSQHRVKTAVNTRQRAPAADASRPAPEDAAKAMSISPPTPTPGHNWTIQIGAYADQALAEAQLNTYVGKAKDVLAQAAQIIAPITIAAMAIRSTAPASAFMPNAKRAMSAAS